jgi:hypothetical protein
VAKDRARRNLIETVQPRRDGGGAGLLGQGREVSNIDE